MKNSNHPSFSRSITSNKEEKRKELNEHTKFAIRLSTLATCVNKIDAGIDIENSYHKLLEEVKALCLNYRL